MYLTSSRPYISWRDTKQRNTYQDIKWNSSMPFPLLYWTILPKYVSTNHEIKRSSSLSCTSSLHYDAPAERVDQNAGAHTLTSRDTLHLTLCQSLCFCWMSGACDSISFETIWTWSNIFRICSYIVGSSSISLQRNCPSVKLISFLNQFFAKTH